MNNRFATTDNSNGRPSSGNRKQAQGQGRSGGGRRSKKRSPIFPILLILMGCVVFAFAAWSAITSPALASIINSASAPQQAEPARLPFAQVNIAKPNAVVAVEQPLIQVAMPTATFTALPVESVTQEPLPEIATAAPETDSAIDAAIVPEDAGAPMLDVSVPPAATDIPAVEQPPAQDANSQPGVISAEIVADTPTPDYVAPTAAAYVPASTGVDTGGEHWIDVDLSQQRVYAYAGDTVVNSFVVSTGTWQTPTVTGRFKVWVKLRSAPMSGPGYYLPDVPYIMYFYGSYGLHGTYWHNNFGTPMSHGCVNLTIPDAEWLYSFSSVGTVVNVHY